MDTLVSGRQCCGAGLHHRLPPYIVPQDRPGLYDCARGMLYGGRRQCILPQTGLPKWRSPYGVYVLDMEDAARQ